MANTLQNQITQTVSPFIPQQFPEFLRESSPQFVAFVQAYYEFLETQYLSPNTFSVVYNAKNLLNYKDVDSTTDAFIQYFMNDFLPYFPSDVALDKRKLIKASKQFYNKKGTPQSIQFLFRVLYNEEADIYFPKENILKASDGKWVQPQALRLLLTANNDNFPVAQLEQRVGYGSNSNAQCVIEAAYKTVDPNLGFEIVEVFVSNITKPFDDLENLVVIYGTDANNNPLIFEQKIIAALSNIVINPNARGLKYNTGNPVVITGGLEPNDTFAQKAVAYVGNVTTGSITSIAVNFGGYDYRENPNTLISFINAPGDNTGQGAAAIVSSIDTSNITYLNVNIDSIEYKANAALNSANFAFSNFAYTNANTTLAQAFSFANLQFAPIKTMNVVSGGGGYKLVPNIDLEVVYYTDFTNNLYQINDQSDAANSVQFVDDLGYIAAVKVLYGGTGYSNVTDTIVCQSAIGSGATFNFQTGANGSITTASVTNPGQGYFQIPTLTLANTSNTNALPAGSGAILVAYGYGQGANLSLGVNQIGQIIDINLVDRGFDYISTPNVSLAIQDLVINPISNNQVLQPDAIIYQGPNTTSATYIAYVDSYNITNNVLRLYNYRGTLNVYQNLIATLTTVNQINVQVNVTVSGNVTTYGNGQAKANAIFLNGLINYPGFYLNTDGFLSSDQYIQDANTYHNYSYQIVVQKALAQYKQMLKQIAHPAGMSMLGKYVIPAILDEEPIYSSNISYISPLIGSVNCNAAQSTGIIVGTTDFGAAGVQPNDMIIFDTSDTSRKLQSKLITFVANTVLNLESNTQFAFNSYVNVSATSNLITGQGFLGVIGIGDNLWLNVAGNLISSNVLSLTNNALQVNTTFNVTTSNLVLLVLPKHINSSYQIISAAAR